MGLDNIVDVLKALKARPSDAPPKVAGAELAIAAHGAQLVAELPILVNFGVLRVLTGQAPPLLSIRSAASTLVHTTDLHSLPAEPPKLLRRPVILQASNPRKPLFGETIGLACYELEGRRYLLGLTSTGAALFAQWAPEWTGGEIAESVALDRSPLVDGISATEHRDWGRAAAQFLVTLGVLLDADNCPLELRPIKKSKHNERGIFFAPAPGEAVYSSSGAGDKEQLLAGVTVTGHLKRQRYGVGLAGVKWIWVSAYAARRWVSRLSHYVERAN